MESNSNKSYWDLKPYWCQPWSIISFGILLLTFSWTFLKNIIITLIFSVIIIIWWILFLILAPNLYQGVSEKNNLDE
ncbi:DUF6737 family protein [Prochlorococcus marinus]|uniref:DUF6737 domain-containing protein n=1 Tax=Prochlorococcus marinus XMU1408 TaxID=2213228 RepID=A0A318QYH1_PROMR|nr:DUF6737 family protein [Prochlorococcus marinus]MBW3042399.1 hypothetical protein [Prochlorococcus marinus str. XMU1408]PYE01435.1 hypothetical protein DNJ73_06810 [Prochlorococcus marinus XMU1408]